MRRLNLTLLALLSVAGCSQVLGLGDYEIVEGPNANGGSSSGTAGRPSAGEPSEPSEPEGGRGGEAASGGAPGREVIECDSPDCCSTKGGTAVGVELLSDGGFELGPAVDELSPWFEESTEDLAIVSLSGDPALQFLAKSGDYYAYLSGVPGERSSIYSEDLQVPEDAGWLTLTGYRLFQIDVQDDLNDDFSLIAFYDPDQEDALELPFWWGKPTEQADGWGDTNGTWKKFQSSWDAAPHRGGVRYIGLRGESDTHPEPTEEAETAELDSSSFLYDDISLKAFTCVK
jgi:hypothetical protein